MKLCVAASRLQASQANHPPIFPRRKITKDSRDGAAMVAGNVQIYINIYIYINNTLYTSSAPPPPALLHQSHVHLRPPGGLSGTPPQKGERLGTLMLMSPMLMLRGISGRFMFLTAETARAGAAERPPWRYTVAAWDSFAFSLPFHFNTVSSFQRPTMH